MARRNGSAASLREELELWMLNFLSFSIVMVGGAIRYLPSRLRSLPTVVSGLAVVSFVAIALICISSLDRMGAGATEAVNGRYYLNNHGERSEVSRSGYEAARAADIRFMAVVAGVFLGVSAVAAGNRRNMLNDGYTDEPANDLPGHD